MVELLSSVMSNVRFFTSRLQYEEEGWYRN